jgi:DNA-directed RNA polymerase subunit L
MVMKLKVLEETDGKIRIEVDGETHTLLNVLKGNAWKAGAEQASYIIRHPLMSQPELIIRAKNPRKVLKEAANMVIEDAKEMQKEAKKAFK